MIIDFHTHAFPDDLAERAMKTLIANSGGIKTYHDGTTSGLISCMDRAGITTSVVASIATKPGQFEKILSWSLEIKGPRMIPLGSVHPHCPDFVKATSAIKKAGLPGIKLHPLYQDFHLDDRRVYPLYEELQARNLFVLIHAGYDIAFPGNRQADPNKIFKIHRDFPRLTLVAAHLGGWNLWDEVLDKLAGTEVYLESSMAFGYCPEKTFMAIIKRHDPAKILFGTDSPWADPQKEVGAWEKLGLSSDILAKILGGNALSLLSRY